MKEQWHITILAEGGDEPPDECRMRLFLKALLRRYGMRCVDVKHESIETPTAADAVKENTNGSHNT